MVISVYERGGFLGLDRKIEIKDGIVTVMEKGVTKQRHSLEPTLQARLQTLAASVAQLTDVVVPSSGPAVSDSLETSVEIEEDGGRQVFQLRSGDKAPDEVWQLLGTINDASAEKR